MSKTVSIITIINDESIYKEFLDNINNQNFKDFELIPIYNYNQEFKSATTAFNEYAKKAQGKLLIFMHPDIRFQQKNSLSSIIEYVNNLDDFGIVGVAGAKRGKDGKREILTTIVHGNNKENAGNLINYPKEVQTLDECMFIIKKDYFNGHSFTERASWHLYAVEYCLKVLINRDKVYVIPANLWHMSDGKSLNYKYVVDLIKIAKDYKEKFPVLYTTVKKWDLKGIKGFFYLRYYFLKQYLKSKFF